MEDEARGADAVEEALDAAALGSLRSCRSCFSRDGSGLAELKRIVMTAPDAPWVRQIELNGAVMTGDFSSLRYLVDEVKVESMNVKTQGYYPLHLSIIWGKVDVMVYLLTRGADPMFGGESCAVALASRRQQRLRQGLGRAEDGAEFENFCITKSQIKPLIEQGLVMLEVLQGIELHGSYRTWAQHNGSHPLVQRFSSHIHAAEPRYQLAVLRALVLASRASLRSADERAALAAEAAAQAAARAKEEQPLMDALVKDGFSATVAKDIQGKLRIPTVGELRAAAPSREDIEEALESYVRAGRMTTGECRKFARFVRELMEPAAAEEVAAPSRAAAQGPTKGQAKGGYPAAKAAALLALRGKGKGGLPSAGAKQQPERKSPSQKVAAVDGIAVLFCQDLPCNTFTIIIQCLIGI